MENIENTQIESYLRGKMTPEESAAFEAELTTNPDLLQRTDEMRQFSRDIHLLARADLRKRVEALRDQIKQEETAQELFPKKSLAAWKKTTALLAIGLLFGLVLGWLFFHKAPPTIIPSDTMPIADTPYDELYRAQIPGPQPGQTISLTVSYMPALDLPNQPARKYAFFGLRGGLSIYTRRNDNFWTQPLELTQSGSQFFLKIGNEKFLLDTDGEVHDFPEKPSVN